MRDSKAKAIRKSIYGEDFSPRARKYYWAAHPKSTRPNNLTGQIVADEKRRAYQKAKKNA